MDLYLPFKISFFSLIFFDFIVCKKSSLPDLDSINSKKLNECGRCKVVVDSFNYWLDKTSRGKFEGGDAAWEESKLKSYSRSEIRLVEIQEGLCSELKHNQDVCYAVAEEAEQLLEKWWFDEDPHSMDLYTWLCIENLHHCCPQKHFGVNCEPCPLDMNSLMCSGNGRCDGEGTRKGNGSCICYRGYTGKFCQECATNYYSVDTNQCSPCHKSCDGCSGEGADACLACKVGWQLENGICTDVNECSEPSSCKINQYCINQEGSFSCKSCDKSCESCVGGGVVNCTSCPTGSVLWSGMCVNSKLKYELLINTLKRMTLYFGLSIMTLFISRTSGPLASLIIIIIAFFIYITEKKSTMTVIDVISNLYF